VNWTCLEHPVPRAPPPLQVKNYPCPSPARGYREVADNCSQLLLLSVRRPSRYALPTLVKRERETYGPRVRVFGEWYLFVAWSINKPNSYVLLTKMMCNFYTTERCENCNILYLSGNYSVYSFLRTINFYMWFQQLSSHRQISDFRVFPNSKTCH
jgi:hypothetical protein